MIELFIYGLRLQFVYGFKIGTSIFLASCEFRNVGELHFFQITQVNKNFRKWRENKLERKLKNRKTLRDRECKRQAYKFIMREERGKKKENESKWKRDSVV